METQRIEEPEVSVIGGDGRALETGLTPRERWTVEAAARQLEDSPEFKADCGDAKLVKIESVRGLAEHESGRYYLRYAGTSGVSEFWASLHHHAHLDLQKGLIGVPVTPDIPPLEPDPAQAPREVEAS